MMIYATLQMKDYPPDLVVIIGEDLTWWSQYDDIAHYLQVLSPVLGITPDKPSRVREVFTAVKALEPTLTLVEVEEEHLPVSVRGRVY